MQYIHIRKAMEEIGTTPSGAILVDCIASALSKKSQAQVAAINNELNISFPFFRRRPDNADDVLKARRAALLIARTVDATAALRPAGGAAPYESWDVMELDAYIGKNRRVSKYPTGAGVYLAGSFWAFATEEERSRALAGYREAVELCTFGLVAATQAARGVAVGPYGIYFDMLRMWFGDAPTTVSAVREVLLLTLNGLKGNYVRISYRGRNIPSGSKLLELGFAAGGALGTIKLPEPKDANVIAYVNANSGERPNNRIVMCPPFFDASTSIRLDSQIVAMDREVMQTTRSGVLLHEATHLYAKTDDIALDEDAHKRFVKAPENGPPPDELIAYGTQRCLALARTKPADAVKNADSYRIFCEVAKYHRSREGAPVVIG